MRVSGGCTSHQRVHSRRAMTVRSLFVGGAGEKPRTRRARSAPGPGTDEASVVSERLPDASGSDGTGGLDGS